MKLPWKRKIKFETTIMNRDEKRYYDGLQSAQAAKDVKNKISAYEKNLKSLKKFVASTLKDFGELPPVIPCRDELPELYMRLGDWDNAERVIRYCIACNAYYPLNGNEELDSLSKYKTAAEKALETIKKNPGLLQKNIYKMLKNENLDDYSLKHFMRCSLQIERIPSDGTNKVYAK